MVSERFSFWKKSCRERKYNLRLHHSTPMISRALSFVRQDLVSANHSIYTQRYQLASAAAAAAAAGPPKGGGAGAKKTKKEKAPNVRVVNTFKEGDAIKVNIFKGGKDPVLLKDKDYPEWLFTSMNQKPLTDLQKVGFDNLDLNSQRRLWGLYNRNKIKKRNLRKDEFS